jgi:hypothetical protein
MSQRLACILSANCTGRTVDRADGTPFAQRGGAGPASQSSLDEDSAMTLQETYNSYSRWNLWPQLQGECGVYPFFWFAVEVAESKVTRGPQPRVR